MIPFLDYNEYMNNLIAETSINRYEIYWYDKETEDSNLITEYQSLFNMYQGWLEKQQEFNILKANIFFNPYTNVNAKATKYGEHFIVTINRGAIEMLWNTFQINEKLFEETGLEEFNKIQFRSDWPFNKLMFQLCCHFTFYHELGHLIQDSKLLQSILSEDISSKNNFCQHRHVLEYDADAYSGICLAIHLYQYLDYCEIRNNRDAELIISAICASIFAYLLMFESTILPFYTKENSHPHPFVRLFTVFDYIIGYIIHLDRNKKYYNLDIKLITEKIIVCSKAIISSQFDSDRMKIIDNLIYTNIHSASNYCKELKELNINNSESAINKRNDIAKNKNGL